jgi:hypothetical protein
MSMKSESENYLKSTLRFTRTLILTKNRYLSSFKLDFILKCMSLIGYLKFLFFCVMAITGAS